MSDFSDPAQPSASEIEACMREMVRARGAGRNLDPSAVARALAGPRPEGWGRLMPHIRLAAIRLARAGEIVILRKGKPADPENFKGIYRLAAAPDPS